MDLFLNNKVVHVLMTNSMKRINRTKLCISQSNINSGINWSMSCTTLLQHNPEAEKDVRGAVDWLVTLQTYEGNFPCAMGDLKDPRHYSEELVHWCHGAPGTVYLLARYPVVDSAVNLSVN